MHRSNSFVVIFSLLKSYSIEALPAPQAEASPCSTIVYLPEATLTISPGPSNALVNGFPDGATSTIEANGPAITVGPNLLSLNAENNVNLNGNVFLFSDGFCPAMVIPITTLDPISSGNGETMSSTSTDVIPVVPGPTDTPPADNDPDDDPDGTPVTPVPVPDPDTPETPNDPADPVDPDPPAGNPTDTPTDNPDEPPSDTPSDPPSDSPDDDPSDDPDLPVIPVPVPAPVDPLPAPDPADPIPAPDPADPNDPTITPPPPSPPNNDEPEECETQTANVCTQGCSFGIDTLGATTTTSCNDPSCTTTAACTVSDTTTTTTIITSHSKLSPHTQGPEPEPTPAPEPEPTPEPEPEPTPEPEPEPAPEPEPEPTEPEVTNLVFKAGQLTAADGTESIVIYANAPDSPLNICTDKPFYQEATTVGLSKKFDIPDTSYKECDFVGIGTDPLGIYCKDKERVPCVLQEGTELGSCLAGDSGTFSVTWVCNE